MKIIVMEDIKKMNDEIVKISNQILIERNLDLDVITFEDYCDEVQKIIFNKEIKIYILDVDLPTKSGYDIARIIRYYAKDWNSIIIITSIHNQKEAFITAKLSIFTYLSKFENFKTNLKDTLNLVLEILMPKTVIDLDKEKIVFDDILYIKKEKLTKYCFIKTYRDEFRSRKNINELQKLTNFELIKRNLLINQKNVIYKDDCKIIFNNNLKIEI